MVKSATGVTVRINRSTRLVYPLWVTLGVHFRIWGLGPAEYDLTAIELFLWVFQWGTRKVEGYDLHEYLKRTGMIEKCLDLRDAVEIQRLDPDVFREIFGDSNVFLWRSSAEDRSGDKHVPYLCLREGGIVLAWRSIKEKWGASDLAALFPKEPNKP